MGMQQKWVWYKEFNFRHIVNILIEMTSGQLDITAKGELWEMERPQFHCGFYFYSRNLHVQHYPVDINSVKYKLVLATQKTEVKPLNSGIQATASYGNHIS